MWLPPGNRIRKITPAEVGNMDVAFLNNLNLKTQFNKN
jgi:hypothetical protein